MSDQLPENWSEIKLKKICQVVRGGSPRPMGNPKYFTGDIPFIKISDVTKVKGKYISQTETTVNEEGTKKSRLLPKDSLILSNSGTVCIPKFLAVSACIHDGFVSFLDLSEEINKNYLYYYFYSIRPYVIEKNRQGITQVNLNTGIVGDFDIAIAPTSEQQRIVDKIEELFSELDEGIKSLKTAQQQLKVYRQAVLKWAFEGKLTAQWREEQQSKLESAETLLAQIKTEREQRYQKALESWQAEVEVWEANGNIGKRPSKPKKLKELSKLNQDDLRNLETMPNGWFWEKLGNVSVKIQIGPFGSLLHKADYVQGKIPAINPTHIRNLKINVDTNFTVTQEKFSELKKYALEEGDIIMGRRGEMGRCALVTNQEDGFLGSRI